MLVNSVTSYALANRRGRALRRANRGLTLGHVRLVFPLLRDMQSIGRGSAYRVDRPDHKAEVEAGGIPWRELVHHAVDAHRVGRREREHAEQGRDRHEKDGRLTPPLATVVVVVSMKQMTERWLSALSRPGGDEGVLARW